MGYKAGLQRPWTLSPSRTLTPHGDSVNLAEPHPVDNKQRSKQEPAFLDRGATFALGFLQHTRVGTHTHPEHNRL